MLFDFGDRTSIIDTLAQHKTREIQIFGYDVFRDVKVEKASGGGGFRLSQPVERAGGPEGRDSA